MDIEVQNLINFEKPEREVQELEYPHLEVFLNSTRNRGLLKFLMNEYKDENRQKEEYPLFISLEQLGKEGKGKIGKMSLKDTLQLSSLKFKLFLARDKEPIDIDTGFFSKLILSKKVFR